MGSSILALDIGEKRIGVAVARAEVRLASQLPTLTVSDDVLDQLQQIIHDQEATVVVVGLPRNLQGDDTPQTAYVREFAAKLQALSTADIAFQDEALTSRQAEAELAKTRRSYAKDEVDALAAQYILEDYLQEHTS